MLREKTEAEKCVKFSYNQIELKYFNREQFSNTPDTDNKHTMQFTAYPAYTHQGIRQHALDPALNPEFMYMGIPVSLPTDIHTRALRRLGLG